MNGPANISQLSITLHGNVSYSHNFYSDRSSGLLFWSLPLPEGGGSHPNDTGLMKSISERIMVYFCANGGGGGKLFPLHLKSTWELYPNQLPSVHILFQRQGPCLGSSSSAIRSGIVQ